MSEILSALTDGQAGPDEAAQASAEWRDDPRVRATWHRYQVIGDALRSPELLKSTEGARFLRGFRARLAHEPVVLAPQATASSGSSSGAVFGDAMASAYSSSPTAATLKRRPWAGPTAVAASFVLLVGLMASNLSGLQGDAGSLARTDALVSAQSPLWNAFEARLGQDALWPSNPQSAPVHTSLQGGQVMGPSFETTDHADGVLIRDPRVEPLLSLQRPMVIDPPPSSFAEPGLQQTSRVSAP